VLVWDQILELHPLPGHQFNLKSPNSCGKGHLLQVTEHIVSCRMSSPGTQELEVFVCDVQKSFCKREILAVRVQWPQTFAGIWQYLRSYFLQ
jgi:hypothetical protein